MTINRMDTVDLNEVYLSGLARSPIALDRTPLRGHMCGNERSDALGNALLFRFGEKASLVTRGSSEIWRVEK